MSPDLPVGKEKERAVQQMFDRIAPRYDLVNRIMTFGMDVRWRRRAVRSLALASGDLVADVACGTGDLCREVQRQGGRAIGLDLSFGMLASARVDSPLVQADGLRMPLPDGAVSGVTCGFALRNVTDIDALLAEFHRVLLPGGRIAIIEVAEPRSAVLRWGHNIYFRKIVPFIGGLLSDRAAYRYLPESTAYLPDWDGLRSLLQAAGFVDIDRASLGLGAAQLITAARS